ncbi:MAG: GNAT family N-acetyltransferase [Candidatus Micrarchaeota archaeon]|nr:GNAT family N-acetyltransferase [Candidatus Micrarchaeota archaeon]
MENPVKVAVFNPKQWDKYKSQFMKLERKCYPKELQFLPNEKKEIVASKNSITVIAKMGQEFVGEIYGQHVKYEEPETKNRGKVGRAFKDIFEMPESRRKTFYIDGFAVLPEMQGQGVGIALKRALFTKLRDGGWEFVMGHANDGAALHINYKFGARPRKSYEHWFGGKEKHILYTLNLPNLKVRLDVPNVAQVFDFTCGPASLKSVLQYNGVKASERALSSFGTTVEWGTDHESLVHAANAFGMKAEEKLGANITDIIKCIDKGTPVIVNYFLKKAGEGHYSVAYGYDKSNLYIMDVATGKKEKMSKQEFDEQWFSKRYGKKWMLALQRK